MQILLNLLEHDLEVFFVVIRVSLESSASLNVLLICDMNEIYALTDLLQAVLIDELFDARFDA